MVTHAPPQLHGLGLRRTLCAVVVAAGGLLAAVGCSEGYDVPPLPNGEMAIGDQLCQADMEPGQGDVCTKDCLTATCASGTGRRICTCEGGVFLQCACLPPADWPYTDVPAAPYCDRLTGQPRYLSTENCVSEGQQCVSSTFPNQGCTCAMGKWVCGTNEGYAPGVRECESIGNGLQALLKDRPCDTQWQLCVSRDYNPTGTAPRGCFCNMKAGRLVWQCGGTNRWWRAP
ncbi:MAG: hypothetical protein K0R38_1967 [Polyangiaceae bacterium]|nr:hypothetical protein [Polyangiaceae bacterium]